MAVLCDYCGRPARLSTGREIYGDSRPDLWDKKFWSCQRCFAYVGCHQGTERPLGRLADAKLRRAKIRAHDAFDKLWKGKTARMSRNAAYQWLARCLNLTKAECHIGKFDLNQCERVVAICSTIPGVSR